VSLRTRLILAFLLLSVVPLSAVTLYSYGTSVEAFQRAVEREAAQSASDIGHRMSMVTDDLGRRMDRVFDAGTATEDGDGVVTQEQVRARLTPMLGDAAALVERVEFDPLPPPPAAGTAGVAPVPPAPPPASAPSAPAPPSAPTTIVVELGAILEEARKQAEGSGLSTPEAQARFKAQMERAIRDSVGANIVRAEAAKAAAAATAPAAAPAAAPRGLSRT